MGNLEYLDQFQNPESRFRALSEIPIDNPNLPAVLLRALNDPYPGVRFRAGDRLAELDMEPQVRDLFQSANSKTKQAAMLAFRKATVEPETQNLVLEYAMSAAEPGIRYHALLALHLFGDAETLKAVTQRIFEFADEDAMIIGAQWTALNRWEEFLPSIIDAFQTSQSKDFRFQIAISISKLVDHKDHMPSESIELIIKSVLDDKVSMTACQAIADLDIKSAVGTLKRIPFKVFMHELLKVEAAATLAKLGEPSGKKSLAKFINDKREHVRAYACECAGRYNIEVRESLLKAQKRNDDSGLAATAALDKLS